MGVVYALAHPVTFEVRYIGQTRQEPDDRLRRHMASAKAGHYPVNRWIRKHGRPIMQILEEAPDGELDEIERDHISIYRNAGVNLLNVGDGGAGSVRPKGSHLSDIWKERISKSVSETLNSRPEEVKREHREKIKDALTGTPHTEERKENIRRSKQVYTDEILTEVHRLRLEGLTWDEIVSNHFPSAVPKSLTTAYYRANKRLNFYTEEEAKMNQTKKKDGN